MIEPRESFTVRVNRPLLLFFVLFGALFVMVGLDSLREAPFFDWSFPTDKPLLVFAFYFFFIGCGGLIVLNCLGYLVVPPVLWRFDERGVTFGVGMRYRPFTIAWRHVKSIDYGVDVSLTMKDQFFAGACVTFEPSPEIPSMKACGMGLGYFAHRLTLHWLYANRLPWTVVEAGNDLWKRYHLANRAK